MADIQTVTLENNVRTGRGVNSEQTSTLDIGRESMKDLTFEESTHGVRVYIKGALFSLIPWPLVRQVVYAPSEATKPETPAAKAK